MPRPLCSWRHRCALRLHLDDRPCYALFEYRAELEADGDPLELTPDLEPLRQVCDEFGLHLVSA